MIMYVMMNEVEESEVEMVDDMTQVCVKAGKVRGVNTCF